MRYISIDTETTGLDPDKCDILQVAAVIDDLKTPLKELPSIEFVVGAKWYTGDPYALAMNHKILERIAKNKEACVQPIDIGRTLRDFCLENKLEPSFICAGKNFSSFDRQFLLRAPFFEKDFKMKHRSIDPGSMYLRASDQSPPSLDECLERMGVNIERITEFRHDALFDCKCVIQCIRYALNGMSWSGIPDNWNAI